MCAVAETLASDLRRDLPGKLYRAGIWTRRSAGNARGDERWLTPCPRGSKGRVQVARSDIETSWRASTS